jgi:Ca2+:H+ antiporter
VNLDKLRGQAKHAAWYDQPDDPPTFNPFRKVRTGFPGKKNALRNAENGDGDLTRCITDQENQHADVLRRRDDMGGAAVSQKRLATAPISDRSHTKTAIEDTVAPIGIDRTASPEPEKLSLDKDSPLPLEETEKSASSNTVGAEDPAPNERPRQRKGMEGMFHRNKEEDSDQAEEDHQRKLHYTFTNQIKATLFNSWINFLLLAGKPKAYHARSKC